MVYGSIKCRFMIMALVSESTSAELYSVDILITFNLMQAVLVVLATHKSYCWTRLGGSLTTTWKCRCVLGKCQAFPAVSSECAHVQWRCILARYNLTILQWDPALYVTSFLHALFFTSLKTYSNLLQIYRLQCLLINLKLHTVSMWIAIRSRRYCRQA